MLPRPLCARACSKKQERLVRTLQSFAFKKTLKTNINALQRLSFLIFQRTDILCIESLECPCHQPQPAQAALAHRASSTAALLRLPH